MSDEYEVGGHRSDDAPARAPRAPRDRTPKGTMALSRLGSPRSVRRGRMAARCKSCPEMLDTAAPPELLDQGRGGQPTFLYRCPNGHEATLTGNDFSRAYQGGVFGMGGPALAALITGIEATRRSVVKAERAGEFDKVATLSNAIVRANDFVAAMMGLKKTQIQIEHTGTGTDSANFDAEVERRLAEWWERAKERGTGQDAEVVDDHPSP